MITILSSCAGAEPVVNEGPAVMTNTMPQPEGEEENAAEPTTVAEETDLANGPTGWEVEVVAENLNVPWSVVFPSEDRILVSERVGTIQEVVDGQVTEEPVYEFNDVFVSGEAGLMGMALHPDFEENGFVYVCYTNQTGAGTINRVVRLVDGGETLTFDSVIMDNIPSNAIHAGGRIEFGPDGKLYITTGDTRQADLAQDTESLAGKILRINPDGSIPDDNPFPGSPVYSYGHRNPEGISWDEESGLMLSTEHGPSGFDGPPGGDEINFILAGANYGWPLVSHEETLEGAVTPIITFTPAEAPASALVYNRDELPFFTGDLFFGALVGRGVVRVELEIDLPDVQAKNVEKIVTEVGRVRDVETGPDGYIYFTTSNHDGRGDPREGDDKIYRIVPVFE